MFKVYWDNGAEACGTFPQEFATPEAAEAWGREWATEMNIEAGLDPEDPDGYTYEVVQGIASV